MIFLHVNDLYKALSFNKILTFYYCKFFNGCPADFVGKCCKTCCSEGFSGGFRKRFSFSMVLFSFWKQSWSFGKLFSVERVYFHRMMSTEFQLTLSTTKDDIMRHISQKFFLGNTTIALSVFLKPLKVFKMKTLPTKKKTASKNCWQCTMHHGTLNTTNR